MYSLLTELYINFFVFLQIVYFSWTFKLNELADWTVTVTELVQIIVFCMMFFLMLASCVCQLVK